jgi:probable phosphoglycerate mutase
VILIARHGETEWNTAGRMQGWQNSPLTDTGIAQAKRLAWVVDSYDIERIVSSPLGRARETATIVAEYTGLPVETDDRLREIDIGAYSGLTKDEVHDRDPEFFERPEKTKWKCRWPDGESYADASERVGDFVQQADTLHDSVILAHRSLNRVLLGQLADLSPAEMLSIEQENNAVFEVTVDGQIRKRRYDDTLSE